MRIWLTILYPGHYEVYFGEKTLTSCHIEERLRFLQNNSPAVQCCLMAGNSFIELSVQGKTKLVMRRDDDG